MSVDYKIGIAPINWCNDDDPSLGADISFEQCIKEMAETGYQGCEIGNKFPRDVNKLKSHLKPHNLEISSAWFSSMLTVKGEYENTLSRFLHHVSFLNNLGAKFVTIAECGHAIHGLNQALFGSKRQTLNSEQWNCLIQGLHVMGRMCHDYDMKLVYHQHLGTVIESSLELDNLMRHTSPQLLGLLLDTGHAYAAGINPHNLLEQYADRIDYIHLKDLRINVLNQVKQGSLSFMQAVKAGMFTVPSDGDIDFISLFQQIKNINYKGWLIVEAEQDPAIANPMEYAKKAREFILEYTGV